MITVTLACDVPTCQQSVTKAAATRAVRSTADQLLVGARDFGWWTDDLGRAWCPNHRAKDAA